MKTFIILSLLVTGCGEFNEEASNDGAAQTVAGETSLETINSQGFRTSDFAFNLERIQINYFETEGSHADAVMKYFQSAEKSVFFRVMADGSMKDCNAKVFIGIIKNYKGSGKPLGSFIFDRVDYTKSKGEYDPCDLYGMQYDFHFEGQIPVVKLHAN